MRLSLIISTYNQPEWLELVLWGLTVQTWPEFELLVADDGSDGRTRKVVEQFESSSSLSPIHVWHADRGFRKCTILNRAIEQADGEYLVFLDGDCIPRCDFLERHASLARPGRFLSGGAVRLTRPVSLSVRLEHVLRGRVHEWKWLRSRGQPASRDAVKLLNPPRQSGARSAFAGLLDAITPTKPTFNGGNASAWRDDLLGVNGFDERMGYGGLDRELGERLENAGVRGRQVRHRCVCVHLDHPRCYANSSVQAFNDRLREQTRSTQATWTAHGIARSQARAA